MTGLLFFSGITIVPQAWGVDSRKVEKMIEDSPPEKEQALSAEKRKQLLKAGAGNRTQPIKKSAANPDGFIPFPKKDTCPIL